MKARHLIVVLVALLCLAALTVNAQTVNEMGSSGVAVPVGTSTPVIIQSGNNRCNWTWNWTGGNMMCEPVPKGTSSPSIAPDQTHGFLFTQANAPWTSDAMSGDPSIGWSCVSTSGTISLYTYADLYCLKKGPNP